MYTKNRLKLQTLGKGFFVVFFLLLGICPAVARAEGPYDPVLIIPGIAGTYLWNGSMEVSDNRTWLSHAKLLDQYIEGQSYLTEGLSLSATNGQSIQEVGVGDVILENLSPAGPDVFQGLIDELEDSDYVESASSSGFFKFSYDWRLNLSETTELLKAKINEIKSITGATNVDIVAHSMGGLLVKNYISASSTADIGKLIFIGTPHLGAPKAAKVLLIGDNLTIPWLRSERIKEISENSPAIYELLPREEYFEELEGTEGYIQIADENQIPQTLDYEETQSFLFNDAEGDLNDTVFALTENFFDSTSSTDFTGADVYNFAGCNAGTPSMYAFGSNLNDYQTITGVGDGTVPLISGDGVNISSRHKYYVKNIEHSELPSGNDVRQAIIALLTQQTPVIDLGANLFNDIEDCNNSGKLLTWRGPVEVHIYDDVLIGADDHVGPVANDFDWEIEGVTYDAFGQQTTVFLPANNIDEYEISAAGTAIGTLDLRVSTVVDNALISTTIFNDLATTTTSHVTFNVTDESDDDIVTLATGSATTSPTAIATLSGDLGNDLTPPNITASATGTLVGGSYTSTAYVTLSASDTGAGLYRTYYAINGGSVVQSATTSTLFSVTSNGTTTIEYYAVDYAGNNSATGTLTVNLARPSVTLGVASTSCYTGEGCNSGNTFTLSLDVAAEKEYLIADVYQSNGCSGTVTAVYGSATMTQIASTTPGGAAWKQFGLVDPTTSPSNLVVTKPSGSCDFKVVAASFANVNVDDPYGTIGTNAGGSGGSMSTTVTGVERGLAYSVFVSSNDLDVSPNSPLASVIDATANYPAIETATRSGTGTITTAWTIASQGCCAYWGLISTPLKPDSVRPVTTITDVSSTGTSATFTFKSNAPGSTFKCAIGVAPYSTCTSPVVYEDLPGGDSVFSVYAIDGEGYRDLTPATWEWGIEGVSLDDSSVCTQNSTCFANPVATLELDATEENEYLLVNTYRTAQYCAGDVVATYAGATMTRITLVMHGESKWEQFELLNPETGPNDLVVTRPSGSCDTAVIAALFKGVDLDDPYNMIGTAHGATGPTTKTASATGTQDGLIYSVMISPNDPHVTTVSPLIQFATETSHPTIASSAGTSAVGEVNTSWDIASQECCAYWAIISTALNADDGESLIGGGGGGEEMMMVEGASPSKKPRDLGRYIFPATKEPPGMSHAVSATATEMRGRHDPWIDVPKPDRSYVSVTNTPATAR